MNKYHVWIPEEYELPSVIDMVTYLCEMGIGFDAKYHPDREGTMFVFCADSLPALWGQFLCADNLVTEVAV